MQYAVGVSIALLLIVCAVPFLQPIFNTHFLSRVRCRVGLALIPARKRSQSSFYEEARRNYKKLLQSCGSFLFEKNEFCQLYPKTKTDTLNS
jgi:hypothetical protein